MDRDNPIADIVGGVFGIAGAVWSTWATFVAFAGGTAPLLGWELEGGLGSGLLWLFIVEPIVITVAFWIGMLVALPLLMIFRPRER